MKLTKNLSLRRIIIVVLSILLLGFCIYMFNKNMEISKLENFDVTKHNVKHQMFKECPTTLVQDGAKYLLFNDNLPEEEGVNPLQLDGLDDYLGFLEWQRSQGIECPILHVQSSYNTQGEKEFRVKNDPIMNNGHMTTENPNGRLAKHPPTVELVDASRESETYNINQYPGFDPYNQNSGDHTPLDKMFSMTTSDGKSPNPMDSEWGGVEYTRTVMSSDRKRRENGNSKDFEPVFIFEENMNRGYKQGNNKNKNKQTKEAKKEKESEKENMSVRRFKESMRSKQ